MDHSKERIEALKKEHGSIFKYTSKDGKTCLLKPPSLQILDACKTVAGASGLKFDKALVENCWIEGDVELKTVDKYLLGLFDWLVEIIKKIDGELEEL